MPCALHVVVTAGYALSATLDVGGAPTPISRGSLVRDADGTCAAGVPVEILSANPTYALPAPAAGTRGCIDPAALAPAAGLRAVAPGGDVIGPLPAEACGDPAPYAGLRPATPEQLAAIESVRAAYAERFGPIGLDRIPFTAWGYVGLPLRHLDDEEIAAVWAREGLDTPERREKAVIAHGPSREQAIVYAHFLGSDAPDSDRWALPSTVIALLALADGWYTHCTGELAASAAACTLQVGDLAWFGPLTPDPLGHADHFAGTCADIRLFRTDGSGYEAWWNRPDDRPGRGSPYSPDLTAAFLRFALDSGAKVAYFNDPAVIAAVPGVERARGHDDHAHVCF
jgi:hypothetical protein